MKNPVLRKPAHYAAIIVVLGAVLFGCVAQANARGAAPFAGTSDASTLITNTIHNSNGSLFAWHSYRGKLVAISSSGRPMCLTSQDGKNCLLVPNVPVEVLQSLIFSSVKPWNDDPSAANIMVCGDTRYLENWGAVPSEANHWCNAFVNQALTVRAELQAGVLVSSQPALSKNYSERENFYVPSVAYTVPGQLNATGPESPIWDEEGAAYARVSVSTINRADQTHQDIVLRGRNLNGCGAREHQGGAMHNASPCYGAFTSQLLLEFSQQDNPRLPAGEFVGSFQVDATPWGTNVTRQQVIFVDIVNNPAPPACRPGR